MSKRRSYRSGPGRATWIDTFLLPPALAVAVVVAVAAPSVVAGRDGGDGGDVRDLVPLAASAPSGPGPVPAFTESDVVTGLDRPWDLAFTPDGTMIFTQRRGVLSVRTPAGTVRALEADLSDLYAQGETGLMGVEVAPDFATSRLAYTCQGHRDGDGVDVRVISWRISTDYRRADRVADPLLSGIDVTDGSGRHGGCRLRFDPSGALLVGTGDAAVGATPQDRGSLNGKVLRVDRTTGRGAAGNPFAGSADENERRVWTYGHRNVQGLAIRPGTGEAWSAEHGSGRDDEVNQLVPGGNHGWDPVPGYNEAVPMTDTVKFPDARRARWSSGSPTIAVGGISWLTGSRWGRWEGALAVGVLKDRQLLVLTLDDTGRTVHEDVVLEGRYGRIRTVQSGPDGALYLTTDNGGGDRIVKLTPTAAPTPYQPGLDVSPAGVAAAARPSGVSVAVRGSDDAAWIRSSASSGSWSSLGGSLRSAPALVSWGGERLDVFAVHSGGALAHRWFDNGRWSSWELLGGVLTTAPVAVSTASGRLDVLARGTDQAMHRLSWDGVRWSGWRNLGGTLTSAPGATVDRAAGTIRVEVRGTDGGVYRLGLGPTTTVVGWRGTGYRSESAPALGDGGAGAAPTVAHRGAGGALVLRRGGLTTSRPELVTSAPDVVDLGAGRSLVVVRGEGRGVYSLESTPGAAPVWRALGGVAV